MERAVEPGAGSDDQALKPFGWEKDTLELRERARMAVAGWRQRYPQGNYGEMVSALWPDFPFKEFDVVLRGFLTAIDRHHARDSRGCPVMMRAAAACLDVDSMCGFQHYRPLPSRCGGVRDDAGSPRPPGGRA